MPVAYRFSGDSGIRTHDLLNAIQALSQPDIILKIITLNPYVIRGTRAETCSRYPLCSSKLFVAFLNLSCMVLSPPGYIGTMDFPVPTIKYTAVTH